MAHTRFLNASHLANNCPWTSWTIPNLGLKTRINPNLSWSFCGGFNDGHLDWVTMPEPEPQKELGTNPIWGAEKGTGWHKK